MEAASVPRGRQPFNSFHPRVRVLMQHSCEDPIQSATLVLLPTSQSGVKMPAAYSRYWIVDIVVKGLPAPSGRLKVLQKSVDLRHLMVLV